MAPSLSHSDVWAGPRWAEWNSGVRPYSVGIEEEAMLLDPQRNWALAQRIDDVLHTLPAALAGYVSAETHQAAIELRTDPYGSMDEAVGQLSWLRAELADALAKLGLAAASAGAHPLAQWSDTKVTASSRYQVIRRTMRDLATREPTFALHVHIAVPDQERAIELYNRMRVHLPLLLALSANSPFWRGRDAGFASTRTIIFQGFPRTGIPRRYRSYREWVEMVDLQIRAGAIPEPTFLWWDVRLQPRLGTVEVRIMDAQSRLAETAALAGLVQAIARLELEEGYVSEESIRAEEVLAENRFLAARDGVEACLIDTNSQSLRPIEDILDNLLEAVRPHAAALRCGEELESVAPLVAAPGAARQRACASSGEGLGRMIQRLVAVFTE